MKINYATEDTPAVDNVEFVEKDGNYTQKKSNKMNFVFLILCVVAAFVIWCYANYVDDPIILKDVTVEFVLINGEAHESITPSAMKIQVYGEKSILTSITNNTVTIYVDRSVFNVYDEYIDYTVDYPTGIHSHITSVKIKLSDFSDNYK